MPNPLVGYEPLLFAEAMQCNGLWPACGLWIRDEKEKRGDHDAVAFRIHAKKDVMTEADI